MVENHDWKMRKFQIPRQSAPSIIIVHVLWRDLVSSFLPSFLPSFQSSPSFRFGGRRKCYALNGSNFLALVFFFVVKDEEVSFEGY